MENFNAINCDASAFTVTDNTTLGELLTLLNLGDKPHETPTPKMLRETAGAPIATEECCTVYANGYAVYDNGSGHTVVWLPSCTSFTYHFDALKDSEKGGEMKETTELPEGLLESLPWTVAVSLIGDHRVEANMMNRMGSRTGTKDYDSDDNGDKDGDIEEAMEKSLRSEYFWRDGHFGENPEDAYIRKETLQEMLDAMTESQREAFVLYYRYGYTQPEIAAQLRITKQSVNERLQCALERAKGKREIFS
jgi:RNA polymerase sigma factor (sigma-70 family)